MFRCPVEAGADHQQARFTAGGDPLTQMGRNFDRHHLEIQFDPAPLNTDPGADHIAGDGDRQVATEDHSVDADDTARSIEQWTARIARRDTYIRFDMLWSFGVSGRLERANAAHDASSSYPALPPWMTNREDQFAHAQQRGKARWQGGEVIRRDLERRQV